MILNLHRVSRIYMYVYSPMKFAIRLLTQELVIATKKFVYVDQWVTRYSRLSSDTTNRLNGKLCVIRRNETNTVPLYFVPRRKSKVKGKKVSIIAIHVYQVTMRILFRCIWRDGREANLHKGLLNDVLNSPFIYETAKRIFNSLIYRWKRVKLH